MAYFGSQRTQTVFAMLAGAAFDCDLTTSDQCTFPEPNALIERIGDLALVETGRLVQISGLPIIRKRLIFPSGGWADVGLTMS
jgi:hypothetical protein